MYKHTLLSTQQRPHFLTVANCREVTNQLKAWIYEHIEHPYPNEAEKFNLMKVCTFCVWMCPFRVWVCMYMCMCVCLCVDVGGCGVGTSF
jgi:hypothetical protein